MKKSFSKISKLFVFLLVVMTFAPVVVFAQQGLAGVMDSVTTLIAENFIRLIFALAFAYFFWGVAQYALYPDDQEKKDKGKQFMVWGLIALTVMFTVYGLIRVVQNTFDLNDNPPLNAPQLPG